MSHTTDADFVAHLRSMAATTPDISMPDAGTIVRAGRSRLARRRSAFAGAFSIVLFAGAGLTSLLGGSQSTAPYAFNSAAVVAEVAPGAAADLTLNRALPQPDMPQPAAQQPAAQQLATPLTESVVEAPAPLDAAIFEAAPATPNAHLSPLATGLGIAGTASLASAAGLAIRSRRLQPGLVKARNY